MSEAQAAEHCIIVGGGPAGLTAAIYLARFHLSAVVFDDHQSRAALIPLSRNLAGFPHGISGQALIQRMRAQAEAFGAKLVPSRVESILREADGFRVSTDYTAMSQLEIRNTRSPHWRPWLGPESHCLVPLTAFNEGSWLEPVDPGVVMFFAGIEVRGWRSVRRVRDGETEDDLFAFLTTTPSAEVAAIHEKAMPVVLTTQEEWQAWLTLPWPQAGALQRPLPDGTLRVAE